MSEAAPTTSGSQIVAQKSPLHSPFQLTTSYHPPVAFSIPGLGKILHSCSLHWIPQVPMHCSYFEVPAEWLETFEEWKWEAGNRSTVKFIKFHRGNVYFFLAKMSAVIDLNRIDLIIEEMTIFSLKLALKAFKSLHFWCPSSPRPTVHVLLPPNVLSWVCFGPDVLQYRVFQVWLRWMVERSC